MGKSIPLLLFLYRVSFARQPSVLFSLQTYPTFLPKATRHLLTAVLASLLFFAGPPPAPAAPPHGLIRIHSGENPSFTILDSTNSKEILTLTHGAVRKSFSIGKLKGYASYGKDPHGKPVIILMADKDNKHLLRFMAFDRPISLPANSMVNIHLSEDYKLTGFTPGYVGKISISGTVPKPGTMILPQALKLRAEASPRPIPPSLPVPSPPTPSPHKTETPTRPIAQKTPLLKPLSKEPVQPSPATPERQQHATVEPPPPPSEESPELPQDQEPAPPLSTAAFTYDPVSRIKKLSDRALFQKKLIHTARNLITTLSQTLAQWEEPPPLPVSPAQPFSIESIASEPSIAAQIALEEMLTDMSLQQKQLDQSLKELLAKITRHIDATPDPDFALKARIPPEFRQTAYQANQLFQEGDLQQAESLYQKILTRYPKSLYALSNLSVLYFNSEAYDKATETLTQALAAAPHDAFSHSILGVSHFRLGQLEPAMQSLAAAIALNPDSASSFNFLSLIASEKGWQEPAEMLGMRAIEINPNYAEAHYNLAVIFASQTPPSEALARRHYLLSLQLGAPPNESLEETLGISPSERESHLPAAESPLLPSIQTIPPSPTISTPQGP